MTGIASDSYFAYLRPRQTYRVVKKGHNGKSGYWTQLVGDLDDKHPILRYLQVKGYIYGCMCYNYVRNFLKQKG